jgi:hypothetical protein
LVQQRARFYGRQLSKATDPGGDHVRATTAFNRILSLPWVRVRSVELEAGEAVIGIRLSSSRLRCACGYATDTSAR